MTYAHVAQIYPWITGAVAIGLMAWAAATAWHRRAALAREVTALREIGFDHKDPLCVNGYRIVRRLGVGGMAKVFLAVGADHQKIALKIPDPQFFITEAHRAYFRQELSVGTKMQHPNIVRILDYSDGANDTLPYIAMEYVDGAPLDHRLPKGRPVPLAFAVGVLYAVTCALEYAHNMGVVHRDIKPANIILGRRGIKVTDFGIARDMWDQTRTTAEEHTFVGSPHYMSPEQINCGRVDYRTDYYALGVLAFRMLTGYLPFEGDNTLEVITRKVTQLPPPPSTYNRNIPLDIEQLIRELMRREPDRRPVSALTIRKTFRSFLPNASTFGRSRRRKVSQDADFF